MVFYFTKVSICAIKMPATKEPNFRVLNQKNKTNKQAVIHYKTSGLTCTGFSFHNLSSCFLDPACQSRQLICRELNFGSALKTTQNKINNKIKICPKAITANQLFNVHSTGFWTSEISQGYAVQFHRKK